MESSIEFVCADMPTVNRLTVHVVAAVAEEEARAISIRTTQSLAAWKIRHPDRRLGSPGVFQPALMRSATPPSNASLTNMLRRLARRCEHCATPA